MVSKIGAKISLFFYPANPLSRFSLPYKKIRGRPSWSAPEQGTGLVRRYFLMNR